MCLECMKGQGFSTTLFLPTAVQEGCKRFNGLLLVTRSAIVAFQASGHLLAVQCGVWQYDGLQQPRLRSPDRTLRVRTPPYGDTPGDPMPYRST